MVNPDAAQRLEVSFKEPRAGSCLTKEVLAELAGLIEVKLPAAAISSSSAGFCISKDANNIAAFDGENCILVPGTVLHEEEDTWEASGGDDVVFTGFVEKGIDPKDCFLTVLMFLDSAETGTEVQADPSGTAFIRPSWELVERSASKVTVAVKNAVSDVRLVLQLLQPPTPQQQT